MSYLLVLLYNVVVIYLHASTSTYMSLVGTFWAVFLGTRAYSLPHLVWAAWTSHACGSVHGFGHFSSTFFFLVHLFMYLLLPEGKRTRKVAFPFNANRSYLSACRAAALIVVVYDVCSNIAAYIFCNTTIHFSAHSYESGRCPDPGGEQGKEKK